MFHDLCPYSEQEPNHLALWEMLIYRDIKAFTQKNWKMVEQDFISNEFQGIHANFSLDPSQWKLAFPSIESYRDEWLKQAKESFNKTYSRPLDESLLELSYLDKIEINGSRACVRKCFNGVLQTKAGKETLKWQTIYFCKKKCFWQISGFVGYLAFDQPLTLTS